MILRTTHRHETRSARTGFTLMELLVVMAIIVIIAGFGGYYILGQLDQAKVSAAIQKAKVVAQAAETYYIDNGEYPQSIQLLLQKNENGKGPYLKSQDAIMDPWGQMYQYDQNGTQTQAANQTQARAVDVFTTVKDGTNRTVGNWSK